MVTEFHVDAGSLSPRTTEVLTTVRSGTRHKKLLQDILTI